MRLGLLTALLWASAAGCRHHGTPNTDGWPSLSRGTLESGGRKRTFLYYVPEGPGPLPVVVSLHGRLGDGAAQDRLGHWSQVASREGFVLLLPDGIDRSWHDARGKTPAAEAGVDDVSFLGDLIDWAVRNAQGDASRVYVAGMSNGGFMANTLACRLSEKIAAIGSVTASVPAVLRDDCKVARPLSVALVLGTEDPLVPWNGGTIGGTMGDRGETLSASDSALHFAKVLGCSAGPEESLLPDVDPSDGTRVRLSRWSGCAEGNEVRLYAVEGGGHTWPKGWHSLGEWAIGRVSQDIDATEELWQFFRAHRR